MPEIVKAHRTIDRMPKEREIVQGRYSKRSFEVFYKKRGTEIHWYYWEDFRPAPQPDFWFPCSNQEKVL